MDDFTPMLDVDRFLHLTTASVPPPRARRPVRRRRSLYDPRHGSSVWVSPVTGILTPDQRIYADLRRRYGQDDSDDPDLDEDDFFDEEGDFGDEEEDDSEWEDVDDDDEDTEGAGDNGPGNGDGNGDGDGVAQAQGHAGSSAPSSGTAGPAAGTAPTPPAPTDATSADEYESVSDSDTDMASVGSGSAPGGGAGQHTAAAAAPAAAHPASHHHEHLIPLHSGPIPRVARARVNLTALSKRYNLYFAVYQDKIHVYRPQPAPEILRGPLLVLHPAPSRAARRLGGYIDPCTYHQANHILVGDLGDLEIVLLAYDDGDIIGYYTHHIVDYLESCARLQRRPQPTTAAEAAAAAARIPRKKPQPFFRETAGMSAWGLAIHKQSRLIAVSTNLVEVNVFAFALCPAKPTDPQRFKTQRLDVPVHDRSPRTFAGASALELESQLRRRDREWRIVLPLGPGGSNIPSIDLIDDADGNAEKVVAIDIYGYVWILDIWKVGSRPLKIAPRKDIRFDHGWGIMAIPSKDLLRTKIQPTEAHRNRMGVDCFMAATQGRCLHYKEPRKPHRAGSDIDSDVYVSDESSESDVDDAGDRGDDGRGRVRGGPIVMGTLRTKRRVGGAPVTYDPETMLRNWEVLVKAEDVVSSADSAEDRLDPAKESRTGIRPGMIICPSLGLTWKNTSMQDFLRTVKDPNYRSNRCLEVSLRMSRLPPPLELQEMAKRVLLVRSLSVSVELLSPDGAEPSFLCQNVLDPPPLAPAHGLWDTGPDYFRCSMLQYIPEISLIVVGNMYGYVALLRPLKTIRRSAQPRQILHVEWILPLDRDERKHVRPPCCLLGIAVSPVPEPGAGRFGLRSALGLGHGLEEDGATTTTTTSTLPRRWRLLLHYMDHTVLQYHIEETLPMGGKLRVRREG